MPENCSPNDCPLEPRMAALERANERHSKTHAEMFTRLSKLETSSAVQKEQYKTILDKLDCLDEKIDDVRTRTGERIDSVNDDVDALEAKPAKRWDGLVDKVIWAVAAAIIAFLLARIGL